MTLKKKLIMLCVLVLTLTLCCFGLVACGDGGNDGGDVPNGGQQTEGTPSGGGEGGSAGGSTSGEEISHTIYKISEDGSTITGLTEYGKTLTELTIPETWNGKTITRIGINAFLNCTSLTSVTIPNSVTSIRDWAFSGCSNLVEMTLPFVGQEAGKTSEDTYQYPFGKIFGENSYTGGTATEQNYYGNDPTAATKGTYYIPSGLKKVTVTGGNLLYGAFSGCNLLTNIVVSGGVESIAEKAFYNCSSLTSVTIGNGVTSIEKNAFSGCTSLTSINIPDSVTSIGYSAFRGCSGLAEMTVPFVGAEAGKTSTDTYKHLFGYIFGGSSYTGGTATMQYYYNSSTNILEYDTNYIPSNLKKVTVTGGDILYGAFSGCNLLTSVTIESGVTSIGSSAFRGCSGLTEMTIPFVGAEAGKTATDTYQYPFGYIFGESAYTGGYTANQYYYGSSTSSTTDTEYYIPSSLKEVTVTGGNILHGAFEGCVFLTSITMPENVTSIGGNAFKSCSKLTSITIPNSVTSIEYNAFRYCESLTSVTIGSGVTSIEDNAFEDCEKLNKVNYTGTVDQWAQISFGDWSSNPTYYAKDLYINDVLLTEANITTATRINSYAFYNCKSLTSVTLGSSLTNEGYCIGARAFYGCSSLESVTFENTADMFVSEYGDATYANRKYDVTITDATQNAEKLRAENGDYSTLLWYYK